MRIIEAEEEKTLPEVEPTEVLKKEEPKAEECIKHLQEDLLNIVEGLSDIVNRLIKIASKL